MAPSIKRTDEKADAIAWLGMLGPPIIWIVNFQIIYAGVLSACANKSKIALLVSSLICLALIVGCALASRRLFNAESGHDARRFMARVGLMTAAVFALVTIAQIIAIFFMDPCLT